MVKYMFCFFHRKQKSLLVLFFFLNNRDLELTIEELQNDVKSRQCYVTINDVESFAFVLSTISRSLVDLKSKNIFQMNLK